MNHIYEFQKYYKKIWILTIMYPIHAQNINHYMGTPEDVDGCSNTDGHSRCSSSTPTAKNKPSASRYRRRREGYADGHHRWSTVLVLVILPRLVDGPTPPSASLVRPRGSRPSNGHAIRLRSEIRRTPTTQRNSRHR
jgi:hypothetical protein